MAAGENYPYIKILLLLLVLVAIQLEKCSALWTGFDLVRPFKGWGSSGTTSYTKISPMSGNGPQIPAGSNFGCAVANIGDIDGNGYDDLVVGSRSESATYPNDTKVYYQTGAVYILFMGKNGTSIGYTRISSLENGGPRLYPNDNFGTSVSSAGDLDGDGINEIAVGAPGTYIAAVYLLYLNPNGTARNSVMIRGHYIGELPPGALKNITERNSSFNNGPPIQYESKFGSSLASLGDFDHDGVPDLAVGYMDASGGDNRIYFLYLERNGTVKNYTQIGSKMNGGPDLGEAFTYFGGSMVAIGDLNGDNITDIAVGAKNKDVAVTSNFKAGVVYTLMMDKDGSVKSYGMISELASTKTDVGLPLQKNDECGSSVAFIGDINKDQMRQQRPKLVSLDGRPSINDIVIGCPQTLTDYGTGTTFLAFLNLKGFAADYTQVPNSDDILDNIAPPLKFHDRFGTSLAGYQDLDGNGLREIVVGAPGDSDNGVDSGAIYIIFLRRRRYHPPVPDFLGYILSITIPLGCCFCTCVNGIIFFFWYFRRKPDEVEIAVKKAGLEITTNKQRKRKDFGGDGKVYVDDYVA